jgi:hypothetical protein
VSTALVPVGASVSTALVPVGAAPGGGVQSVVPYGAGAPGGGAVVPFGMGGGSAVQALVAANPFLAQALAPMIQARQQAMSQMLAPAKPQVHAPPSRIFIGSVCLCLRVCVYVCVCVSCVDSDRRRLFVHVTPQSVYR